MIADPALVLVDMQRDFCAPDGHHGRRSDVSGPRAAVEAAGAFLERYRASGRTPVLVRTTHDETTVSPAWAAKYERQDRGLPCRPGTAGAEFVPELGVVESDAVVTKHRYGAFHGTGLDGLLRSNGVSRVLVGGVNTNVCVESAVRGAFDRDYDVAVLRDCCGTTDPEAGRAALRNLDGSFCAVVESDDVELPPVAE